MKLQEVEREKNTIFLRIIVDETLIWECMGCQGEL